MRYPRVTLRTALAAIALVGIALGAYQAKKRLNARASYFGSKADLFATLEQNSRASVSLYEQMSRQMEEFAAKAARTRKQIIEEGHVTGEEARKFKRTAEEETARNAQSRAESRKQLESMKARAAIWGRLARKYRYAASHPWVTVRPDPPSSGSPEIDELYRMMMEH